MAFKAKMRTNFRNMKDQDYFVSLHHKIKLDKNIPAIGTLHQEYLELLSGATGVLMPKYFSPVRYRKVSSIATNHFPNLSPRYSYRGKAEQIKLFGRYGFNYPETTVYNTPKSAHKALNRNNISFDRPFVLKGDKGGGGSQVFPIKGKSDFRHYLDHLHPEEPVLLQEWIQNDGMDLRIVMVGDIIKSYFRIGSDSFYNNISKGAEISYDLYPEKQKLGIKMVNQLSSKENINLAAFDVMFAPSGSPYFLEINFLFGTKGLGGSRGYEKIFRQAINNWMDKLKKSP